MNERLERLVEQLAGSPTDRVLDDLEARIGKDIRMRRHEAQLTSALAPTTGVAIALALALGVAVGGVMAVVNGAARSHGMFAASDYFSPSHLLEGGA